MKRSGINIRDPFVLPSTDGWYYMTGTRGATCRGEASVFIDLPSDVLASL